MKSRHGDEELTLHMAHRQTTTIQSSEHVPCRKFITRWGCIRGGWPTPCSSCSVSDPDLQALPDPWSSVTQKSWRWLQASLPIGTWVSEASLSNMERRVDDGVASLFAGKTRPLRSGTWSWYLRGVEGPEGRGGLYSSSVCCTAPYTNGRYAFCLLQDCIRRACKI
jgi:hypothetical protein